MLEVKISIVLPALKGTLPVAEQVFEPALAVQTNVVLVMFTRNVNVVPPVFCTKQTKEVKVPLLDKGT